MMPALCCRYMAPDAGTTNAAKRDATPPRLDPQAWFHGRLEKELKLFLGC